MWIVAQGKLATLDRVRKWGINTNGICKLCDCDHESHEHLFSECVWVQELKSIVFSHFEQPVCQSFDVELKYVAKRCKRKVVVAQVYSVGGIGL